MEFGSFHRMRCGSHAALHYFLALRAPGKGAWQSHNHTVNISMVIVFRSAFFLKISLLCLQRQNKLKQKLPEMLDREFL